jgi:hypothetical protein
MNPEEIKKLVKEVVDQWIGKIPISLAGKPLGRNFYLMAIALTNAKATDSIPDLIACARKGDRNAEGALCLEAATRIAAGEKLEEPLAGYAVDLLTQRFLSYKKTKGDKNIGRRIFAIAVLRDLKQRGVDPTSQDPEKKRLRQSCRRVERQGHRQERYRAGFGRGLERAPEIFPS